MRTRIGAATVLAVVTLGVIASGVGPVHAADSPTTPTTIDHVAIENLTIDLAERGGLHVATSVEPGAGVDALLGAILGKNFGLFVPVMPIGPIAGLATRVGFSGAVDADIHNKVTREECLKQGGTVRPDGRCDAGYWDEFAVDLEG